MRSSFLRSLEFPWDRNRCIHFAVSGFCSWLRVALRVKQWSIGTRNVDRYFCRRKDIGRIILTAVIYGACVQLLR